MKRLIASLALLPLLAVAAQFDGVVTHITDGDTLWVRPDRGGAPVKIRIQGIDAPEICQLDGREARDMLAALVMRRHVRVTTRARDVYQRLIARIDVGRTDAGAAMVTHGMAWSTGFRGRRGAYAQLEASARAAHAGVWRHRAESPLDFRRRHGSCHV